jgi:Mrp family chromosome partitioning ATPase
MNWLKPIGSRSTPVNFGPMRHYNAHARLEGAGGETLEVWIRLDGVKVIQASFTTDGDETSLACGSIAAHLSQGMNLGEVRHIRPQNVVETLGQPDNADAPRCAGLALAAFAKALADYEKALKAKEEQGPGCAEGCGGNGGRDGGGSCESAPAACGSTPSATSGPGVGRVQRRILVMSGKGGVGKSTLAVNLAMGSAAAGLGTGLLDADLHGPSVAKLLGLEGETIQMEARTLLPVELGPLKVMSMGFALKPDQAAIWRGPMKAGVLDQFVNQVQWDALEVLVVDCPPGTGDEHLAVHQALGRVDGAIVVTTPQEVATLDARKAVTFCRTMGIPILGVVENMSGFTCASCGTFTPVFGVGGGKRLAKELQIPFLGALPIDPEVGESGDAGHPRLYQNFGFGARKAFQPLLQALLKQLAVSPGAMAQVEPARGAQARSGMTAQPQRP